MNALTGLLRRYEAQLSLPENPYLAPSERVWLAVYDPAEERRMRVGLANFALSTEKAGKLWQPFDLTPLFARWLAASPYRESYFRNPEDFPAAQFEEWLVAELREAVTQVPPHGVLAVTGAGSLFGLLSVSRLIEGAVPPLRGHLLLFFPGTVSGHDFRLLGVGGGWNYRAVGLTP